MAPGAASAASNTTWLADLSDVSFLAAYDVLLDVRTEAELGGEIAVHIVPQVVKFRQLMPMDGIQMRDRYGRLRWKASELLKSHGVFRAVSVEGEGQRWSQWLSIEGDAEDIKETAAAMDEEFRRRFEGSEGMGYYDTAQICMSGHVITDTASNTEFLQDHCSQCGEPTTTTCLHCKAPIRGDYVVPNVIVAGGGFSPAPNFCYMCGKPHPWTEQKLQAALELADELDGLDESERELLKRSLDDLARDTPRTELAATRVKKLFGKLKGTGADVLKGSLTTLATEGAKKLLGL